MSNHRHSPGPIRKRRVAIAAIAATLLLGGAGTAAATYSSDVPTAGAGPAAGDSAPSVRGGLEPLELAPYEPLDIADNAQLGMLPEGEQNYVISPPEQFKERIEAAKDLPGKGMKPNSISLQTFGDSEGSQRIAGAWRFDELPSEITVWRDGDNFGYATQIVHLPGETEWGTYYLHTLGLDGSDSFRITAHDEDGNVFDEIEYTPRGNAGS